MTSSEPAAAEGPAVAPSPWRWWVCGLLLLATTLNYMDRVALNQTAARIREAFSLSNEEYSRLESGFSIAFAFGTLFFGWLVDRVSVRWVYPAVVLGWSAAGFLTGFADTFWQLFACRLMLGGFEAGNWPCGIRTVRQVMPPSERSLGNSLFQSGTAIGAVITPLIVLQCLLWVGPDSPNAWQVPFRVIGAVGLVWMFAWILTVPAEIVAHPVASPTDRPVPFWNLLADRRYWVLVAVIIGVNSSWHTFRVWMPLFLQKQRGFTEEEMSYFTMAYYLVADVGSWTVGLATLGLAKRGMSLDRARILAFAGCTGLVLTAFAIPFLDRSYLLSATLLAFGFGALGLFPTYFALSQDLSAAHQGKVTGTLGFINAIYLAGMFRAQGVLADETRSYEGLLAVSGLPAAAALLVLALFWRKRSPHRE